MRKLVWSRWYEADDVQPPGYADVWCDIDAALVAAVRLEVVASAAEYMAPPTAGSLGTGELNTRAVERAVGALAVPTPAPRQRLDPHAVHSIGDLIGAMRVLDLFTDSTIVIDETTYVAVVLLLDGNAWMGHVS